MDQLRIYSHHHSRFILIANSVLSKPKIEFGDGIVGRQFVVIVSVLTLPDDEVDKPESQFHDINSFVDFLGLEKEVNHGLEVGVNLITQTEDAVLSAERFMDKFEIHGSSPLIVTEITKGITDNVDNLNAQFYRDGLVLVDIGHFATATLLAF